MKLFTLYTLVALPSTIILVAGEQWCEVTTTANCRACPYDDDTLCPIVAAFPTGVYYGFTCRAIGGDVDGDGD